VLCVVGWCDMQCGRRCESATRGVSDVTDHIPSDSL
jgi:hypothetical protein